MKQERVPSLLAILIGVWSVLSPFVLGYGHVPNAMWNDVIVGILAIALAASRFVGATGAWASWAVVALGLWDLLAPTFLNAEPVLHASSNDRAVGIFLLLFGLWSAYVTPRERLPQGPTFVGTEPTEDDRSR